jgi:dsDNA-specific endonuclease/ATPase MutS2
MTLLALLRRLFGASHTPQEQAAPADEGETPLGPDEDPFDEPVQLAARDVLDLHSIPPKQIKAVVEEYLRAAREQRFRYVRIVHGKGVGVQREAVRSILSRTPSVLSFGDAPAEAGGWGATVVELRVEEDP